MNNYGNYGKKKSGELTQDNEKQTKRKANVGLSDLTSELQA